MRVEDPDGYVLLIGQLSEEPVGAAVVARVRASFARQGAMATLGAELGEIAPGRVTIALPIEPRLSQQDGFLHAGVVVAALDSACGYAALTLMRPRRAHADRLPRRRACRAGGRARPRGHDAGDDGASARWVSDGQMEPSREIGLPLGRAAPL